MLAISAWDHRLVLFAKKDQFGFQNVLPTRFLLHLSASRKGL